MIMCGALCAQHHDANNGCMYTYKLRFVSTSIQVHKLVPVKQNSKIIENKDVCLVFLQFFCFVINYSNQSPSRAATRAEVPYLAALQPRAQRA